MSDSANTNPSTPTFRLRTAFEATAADRAALAEDELVPINADIGAAAHTVLAAVPRVQALEREIAGVPVNHARIKSLDAYARAAGHAHAVYAVASAPPEQLQKKYELALNKRAAIRSDVQNLVNHGIVAPDALAGVPNETGYSNVSYDLVSLIAILRTAEERIEGRTITTPEDLEEAELLATELLEMSARREGKVVVPADIASDRQRAFTLLVRSYDETRRALHFLYWGSDEADRIAPSLYAGRNKKKESPKSDTAPAPAAPAPVVESAPVPQGVKGGTPFA